MKYLIICIFITFSFIEISFSQTISDFSYQSILNNPKKIENTFKKLGYSNKSDNSETIHKLAFTYQTLAIQKKNANVTLLNKSLNLTTEMINNITKMTVLDKVYFENISTAKNGFLSPVIGIIRFHK